jgi:hypothetical protein
MKSILKNRTNKFAVDIALIAGLIACTVSTSVFEESKEAARIGANIGDVFHWGTPHCIVSMLLVAIILIHIWQHWGYLKAVISKNLYLKNKVTTITSVLFLATVVSFTLYLSGFTMPTLHFHSMIAHFFVLFAIIHLIMNWKKLIVLLKKKECREQIS